MKTKKKKVSKALLSLLLAVVMVVEPAAGSAVAYAAEQEISFTENGSDQMEEGQGTSDELGDVQDSTDENNSEENGEIQDDIGENDSEENGEIQDGTGEDGSEENGEIQDGTGENGSDESGDIQGGTGENGSDESGDVQDDTGEDDSDESEDVQDGTDENDSDESDDVQDDVEDEDSEENVSDEDEEEIDSDEETDIEDSEEETIEDEDNWQGTGHKAPKLEMQLTSAMVAEKQALGGTAERLELLRENVQYSANQAVFLADSKKYADTVAEGYGAILDSYEDGVAVMVFADDVADIIAMAEDEKVKLPAVYPNYIYTTCEDDVVLLSGGDDLIAAADSSDPFLNPALDSLGVYQYYHSEIKSTAAWAYNDTAGSGIKVAVIDSGIYKNHEDLKGRVASASTTASTPYNKAEDNDGHGTHVSGIIAANKDNGLGGAGIAYKASIVSIKALEYNPVTEGASGSTADIIKAVNSAVKGGARVINMSLGGNYYDALFESAVTAAVDKGVVVVAAAGNAGKQLSTDTNSANFYSPACFDNVITVSAKQKGSASKADFSNYGSGIIDITAPGEGIASSYLNPNDPAYIPYAGMGGTSQASPMVAAAAAYILSVSPDLKNSKTRATVETVKKILQDSATPMNNSSYFGAGLLNVEAAIKMAAPRAVDNNGGTGELTAPKVTIGGTEVKANETIQDTDSITLSATVGNASSSEIKIYYTLNGKAPTEKSTLYEGPFSIEASGTKTIKAIAVYYGKKSKVTSVKVKVNAYVRNFTVSSKSNSTYLSAGKSLTLTTDAKSFEPSYATNKKVNWEVVDGSGAATINASGKLTANANIDAPTVIKVRATAKEPTDAAKAAKAEISITLLPKVTALTLTAPDLEGSKPVELDYNTNNQVQMTVGVEPAAAQAGVAYSSSNEKIAKVNSTGLVTAIGSGTATITAKTTDGSNKKVSFKVKVNKLVQSVEVTPKTGEYQIAAGKSLQMVANVTSDATNKKVEWSIVGDAATINANGKLTAKPSSAVTAVSTVQVTATAKDDGHKTDTKTVTIYPVVINKVALEEGTSGSLGTIEQGTLKTSLQLHPYTAEDGTAKYYGRVKGSGATGLGNFTYTSSNAKIATVSNTGVVQVNAEGKTGTAKIKAVAKDGSGKSATYTVKVVKPVTSITIYSKSGVKFVGKGKKLSLGALVNSDASNKKLKWTSSNDQVAKVDSNGKVTGVSYGTSTQTAIITAKANDNSGVYATFPVEVRPAIRKLAFAARNSLTGQVSYATNVVDPVSYGAGKFYEGIYAPSYFDDLSPNADRKDYIDSDYYWSSFTYSSSNSNVLQIVYDEDGYIYMFTPNKGTATMTFKALDGSGKSCKIKITVK